MYKSLFSSNRSNFLCPNSSNYNLLCANGRKNEDIKHNVYEDLEEVYIDYRLIVSRFSLLDQHKDQTAYIISEMRLVNFLCSKDLIISSTFFPRKNVHEHTWKSLGGSTHYEIDPT
ncbi:craniofacial development protein 2-like [Aphis craccivora]|uniref:Craniofacial development protein 2-like n=1 Tax=Aphis craccivora TaxID=307492 RepID=A0A6G0YPZ1_APHCR|nr:craniofacial development protein 2-like [Aphis craccivora]